MIRIKLQWFGDGTWQGDNGADYGSKFIADRYEFNTASKKVLFTNQVTDQGRNTFFQNDAVGEAPPEDFSWPLDVPFFSEAIGATWYGYFHDGAGGFTVQEVVLTATAVPTKAICFGSATGAITVTPGGGTGVWTYAWADGPTTKDRSLVTAGTYVVTVTDANSSKVTVQVVVGQSPQLLVLLRKTPNSASVEVTGGVPPYSFLWDDGPTTPDRPDLGAGSYACIVTDAQGCTAETVTFTIIENNFFWSGNPITLKLDAGAAYRANPSTKPNLSFVCEVFLEKEYLSENFELVGTVLEQPADRDGRTTFQVQQLLAKFLQPHVPAPGQNTVTRADSLFRRFYLKHAQVYGNPPVRSGSVTVARNYVALGGLNFTEQQTRTWFNSYFSGVKPFLTWDVNPKPAAVDQPEFLYYLVPSAEVTSFAPRVVVTYTDNSQESFLLDTVFGAGLFEIYCLPAGYQQLGLSDKLGKQVVRWEVSVVDEDGVPLSEKRHYVLDRLPVAQRRYLLYANSLGGNNTYVATGEADQEAEVTGEEAQLALALDYDPLQGDTAVQKRQLRPVLKLASGVHLTRATMLGLQDLLLSRRVLLRNGSRWVAGYLKAKQVPIVSEGKTIQTLDLEFYLPRESYFTPLLPQVPAGQPVLPVGPDSGAL
ncbi:SprB repeat-containing protein [Hymenobacter chitinivorans]|uniref:SprB-like repeat protein n=1 Tax=Hymenobacter chitinivorans DSM 11115 TaxID=1121954 RepID=A0A2M9BNC2_9BACT|nr:SprB repeat-containing protein [Hymenobacter chitinivorans]PJJ59448.1 SprB-like repeat protein [Hymenobacter chitinivorans DSM 11115]